MAPFGIGKYLPFFLLIVAYITAHGWPQPQLGQTTEGQKIDLALDKAAEQPADQAGAAPARFPTHRTHSKFPRVLSWAV